MTKLQAYMRIKVLQNIFDSFQQITQWLPNHPGSAFEYHSKAEIMIDFLEVLDCGSVGGFDPEAPVIRITEYALYDRFLSVLKKYNNENDLKMACYFTPDSLGEYFKKLGELREIFNK